MHDNAFTLRLPPHTVTFYEQGQHAPNPREGSIALIRHGTILADGITLSERLGSLVHRDWAGYTWIDHVGFIRNAPDGSPVVSQMGPRGYERVPYETYDAKIHAIVDFDVSDELRANAVANDDAMAGLDYGFAEYLPFILDELTPVDVGVSVLNHVVCSVHATLVAMGLGVFPSEVPTAVIPTMWAEWVGARHA